MWKAKGNLILSLSKSLDKGLKSGVVFIAVFKRQLRGKPGLQVCFSNEASIECDALISRGPGVIDAELNI